MGNRVIQNSAILLGLTAIVLAFCFMLTGCNGFSIITIQKAPVFSPDKKPWRPHIFRQESQPDPFPEPVPNPEPTPAPVPTADPVIEPSGPITLNDKPCGPDCKCGIGCACKNKECLDRKAPVNKLRCIILTMPGCSDCLKLDKSLKELEKVGWVIDDDHNGSHFHKYNIATDAGQEQLSRYRSALVNKRGVVDIPALVLIDTTTNEVIDKKFGFATPQDLAGWYSKHYHDKD